jgi:hypothetical protein
MCAANTIIITIESQNKKETKTTHRSSTSLVVFIVLTCNVGQTMTGSPQTRSAGQVRKSPRGNKVGQNTGKVREKHQCKNEKKPEWKVDWEKNCNQTCPKS